MTQRLRVSQPDPRPLPPRGRGSADLIDEPRIAVLTTVGANGRPQSTAVWFLVDDDGVLKTSITTDRQKYRNLAGRR